MLFSLLRIIIIATHGVSSKMQNLLDAIRLYCTNYKTRLSKKYVIIFVTNKIN